MSASNHHQPAAQATRITLVNSRDDTLPGPVNQDMALWFEVQSFLSIEARLLDDHDLTAWIDLFTDDLHYWMPIVSNKIGRDIGKEQGPYGDLAHFDDDKTSMSNRVKRLGTGMAWAETPPSRTRHLISNIEVAGASSSPEISVRSSFLIYRSHLEYDKEVFAGTRHDVLRRHAKSWQIAKRMIVLDQSVVTQKNLGIFF